MFTDEQDIERELKAALRVEPSADFDSRVRRRIEAAGTSRRLVVPVWLAAAAAVIVAAGWFIASGRSVAPQQPVAVADQRPVTRDAPTPPQTPDAAGPSEAAPPRVAPRRVRSLATSTVRPRYEPEVIVPRDQLDAIRYIVRQVNAGRLAVPEAAAAVANVPAELVIPPLVIDPIPVVAMQPGGDGGRGPKGLQ